VDTELWQPMVFMGVFGLGLGLSMQTLTIAAQNAAPQRDMGVSTASATFFRQMGGTVGVAVFLSVLFSTVGDNIKDAFTRIAPTPAFQAALNDPSVRANPDNKPVFDALQGGGGGGSALQDSSFLQKADPRLARPFLEGFTDSIQLVFLIAAGVMILAFLVSLFIKEIPLRTGTPAASMIEGGEALLPDGPEEPIGKHAQPESASEVTGPIPVVGQRIHGLIQQGDGAAVGGAVLTLIDHSGQQVARGNADRAGRYHLEAPGSGAYVLIASAPGHHPHASALKLDSQPAVVDVTLIGAGEVAGLVRSEAGTAVKSATVTLTNRSGEVISSHASATDGSYRFTSVAAGPYTLVVHAAGYRPSAIPLAVPEVGEVRQDVLLASGAQICGVARNHRGNAIPEARITIVDEHGAVINVTMTDDEGRFKVGDLEEGEYTVIASGYAPTVDHLKLSEGEHATHDVTLGFEEWK
jgi:hypothetical protein